MKTFILLFTTTALLFSCISTNDSSEQKEDSGIPFSNNNISNTDTLPEISPEQEAALEALNTLQTNTDEGNLYSTFAGIYQPFYPPDTSITIPQSEMLRALKQFVESNCSKLTNDEKYKLSEKAALAENEYIVLHCTEHTSNENYENGLPMAGTWVIPNLLGRRDLIIVW